MGNMDKSMFPIFFLLLDQFWYILSPILTPPPSNSTLGQYFVKNLKILLVDDFDTMIRIIRNILNELGFNNIVSAKNGEEAWHMLHKAKFDFIISDWNMPKMTGLELLQKVKGSPDFAHIPFLMVTAEAEKRHIQKAIEAKVDQYIIKPFTSAKLREKILQAFSTPQTIQKPEDTRD